MLYLESFTFNPFQENTYLIYNEHKQCWIVDPGMYDQSEINRFTGFIDRNALTPVAIINTHAHLDHIFGVQALKDRYKIPFHIHEKELPVLQGAVASAMFFGIDFKQAPAYDSFITEDTGCRLSEDILVVRLTPGHSPGSVVFYYPEGKWLIGGDVLFNGSIGRTDLPGGNYNTLIESIRTQLFTLPDDTTVYPGHGPATTIGNEKKYNPFLKD